MYSVYSVMVADNTSDDGSAVSDEEIDQCFKWATIGGGSKLVILW